MGKGPAMDRARSLLCLAVFTVGLVPATGRAADAEVDSLGEAQSQFIVTNNSRITVVCHEYYSGKPVGRPLSLPSGRLLTFVYGDDPRFGLSCDGVGGGQVYDHFRTGERYAIINQAGSLNLVHAGV